MAFYDSVGGLQDLNKMLASALSGMGLDDEEVKDIITDPGMQSLLMALGMPEKDALKLVENMDDPQRLLYHSLIAMAQGGINTATQWIVKNPDAFLNVVCGSSQLLSFVPGLSLNPFIRGVNVACGIRGAQRSVPKIQAYFSNKYDTKASGTASTAVGSGPSSSSTLELE